jgi:hypothetical protein
MGMIGVRYRDPVDKDNFIMWPEEIEEWVPWNFYDLAVEFQMTIKQLHKLVEAAVHGPEVFDERWDPDREFKSLLAEAERDAALLKLPLPIEEALAIWERNRARVVAALPYCTAAKRAEIEKFLEERDASMKQLAQRARERAR